MPDDRIVMMVERRDEDKSEAEENAEESLEDLEKTILSLCSGIEQRARRLETTDITESQTMKDKSELKEKDGPLCSLSPIKRSEQEVAIVTPINHVWMCQTQSTPHSQISHCPPYSRRGLTYPSAPDLEVPIHDDTFPIDVCDEEMTYEDLLAEVSRISGETVTTKNENKHSHLSKIHLEEIISASEKQATNAQESIQPCPLNDIHNDKYFAQPSMSDLSVAGRFAGVQKSRHVFDETSVAQDPAPSADILGLEKFVCSDIDEDEDEKKHSRLQNRNKTLKNIISSQEENQNQLKYVYDTSGIGHHLVTETDELAKSCVESPLSSPLRSNRKPPSPKEEGELSSSVTEPESESDSHVSPLKILLGKIRMRKRKLSRRKDKEKSDKEEGELSTTTDDTDGEEKQDVLDDVLDFEQREEQDTTVIETTLIENKPNEKDITSVRLCPVDTRTAQKVEVASHGPVDKPVEDGKSNLPSISDCNSQTNVICHRIALSNSEGNFSTTDTPFTSFSDALSFIPSDVSRNKSSDYLHSSSTVFSGITPCDETNVVSDHYSEKEQDLGRALDNRSTATDSFNTAPMDDQTKDQNYPTVSVIGNVLKSEISHKKPHQIHFSVKATHRDLFADYSNVNSGLSRDDPSDGLRIVTKDVQTDGRDGHSDTSDSSIPDSDVTVRKEHKDDSLGDKATDKVTDTNSYCSNIMDTDHQSQCFTAKGDHMASSDCHISLSDSGSAKQDVTAKCDPAECHSHETSYLSKADYEQQNVTANDDHRALHQCHVGVNKDLSCDAVLNGHNVTEKTGKCNSISDHNASPDVHSDLSMSSPALLRDRDAGHRSAAADSCSDVTSIHKTSKDSKKSPQNVVCKDAEEESASSNCEQSQVNVSPSHFHNSYDDFVLSLTEDEDDVERILLGDTDKQPKKAASPREESKTMEDKTDTCSELNQTKKSPLNESFIIIDSPVKPVEQSYVIIEDPVKGRCIAESFPSVRRVTALTRNVKSDNLINAKPSSDIDAKTESVSSISQPSPNCRPVPLNTKKDTKIVSDSDILAQTSESRPVVVAVSPVLAPDTKKDISIDLKFNKEENEVCKSAISPVLAPETKCKPLVSDSEYLKMRKTFEVQNETKSMTTVRQSWNSKGIQRPDENLTFSSECRKKNKERRVKAMYYLEGNCRIPPLFRDNTTPNENNIDSTSDCESPKSKKRRMSKSPNRGGSESIVSDLKKQLSEIETEQNNVGLMLARQHKLRTQNLKQQHAQYYQSLKTKQNLERMQFYRIHNGWMAPALLEYKLMILQAEHAQQLQQLEFMSRTEMNNLVQVMEEEKRVHAQRFEVLKEPKRQMLHQMRTQQSRAIQAQLETAAPHATVELWKGPCKSNNGQRSLVEVCLPTDIASFMIREDEIYDAHYVY